MRFEGFFIFCLVAWFLVMVAVKLATPFLNADQLITVDRFDYHSSETRDSVERGQ